jgi:integrase/recombinase XerD
MESVPRLRVRMQEDLRIAGLSDVTCKKYLLSAAAFARYFDRPPGRLVRDDVRRWLLHLVDERHLKPASMVVYLAAVKFLYVTTLRKPEVVDGLRVSRKKSPARLVPTPDELGRILDATRLLFYRTIFLTAYGAGLRRAEVCNLQVGDIDSGSNLIWVRGGKGSKDRATLLGPKLLGVLRSYWHILRPPGPWLFPSRDGLSCGDQPVAGSTVGAQFTKSVKRASVRQQLTFHGLRHGFATSLLENGVDVRTIQVMLGHEKVETTAIYARVATGLISRTQGPLDLLADRLLT